MKPRLHPFDSEKGVARLPLTAPLLRKFLALGLLPLVLVLGLAISAAFAGDENYENAGCDCCHGSNCKMCETVDVICPPPTLPIPRLPPKRIPRIGEMPKRDDSEKTLAPYFFVNSENSDTDALPLKATRAEVKITGVIANVKITQIYKNEGKKVLEAIYVFPASSRAAVHAARMTIGERTIEAQIREREQARQEYEQARREGKTASLLEQQRPNVFQMNVVNILPKDEVKVELDYTELLVPEEGVYEFVYPTVVGPRYSNQAESKAPENDRFVKNPYLHQGEASQTTFGIQIALASPLPIAEISSPSHDLNVEFTGPNDATIGLPDDAAHGNRDVVLRYSLAKAQIQSGVMTYKGEKDNYFLLMMEPPKRPAQAAIVARELIFIVDVSGSMHGFPLNTSKTLMRDLLSNLRSKDSFNLMTFSGDNQVLSPSSLAATPENIQKALDMVERQQGGGGTELLPAMQRALSLPRAEGTSRIVVIVTDGYVNVERQAFELIQNRLGAANFFPFGIGSSVNRHLIEGMARVGRGEPFVVLNPGEAPQKAQRFRDYIERPVLTDIKVEFDGFAATEVEPIAVPDLFAGRPIIVFGKYTGLAKGAIRVTGKTSEGGFKNVLALAATTPSEKNAALRLLWARQRLARLSDWSTLFPGATEKAEIVKIGLDYHLLTAFTSFIAVDSNSRTKDKATTVKQPLPLPQGVEDSAVGGGGMAKMSLGMRGTGTAGAGYGSVVGRLSSKAAEAPMAATEQQANLDESAMDRSAGDGRRRENSLGLGAFGKGPALASKAVVRIKVLSVTKREKAEVEKALGRYQGDFLAAYRKQLASTPQLKGTMTLVIRLDKDGKVQALAVKSSSLKQATLENEILQILKRLALSKAKDEQAGEAAIELSFGN